MGRYLNPILPGCQPDPSVCRVGDTFYLVNSTFEYLPGLPIHSSKNLVDWQQVGHAIERPGQLDLAGLPSSCGLFAPTIRHDGECFAVVCTVVGPDDGSWKGRTGHFAVTALDAAGPWSDPVWIDGVGGFDPSLTFDDGRVWLTGTEPAPEAEWPGQTDVWLVELDPSSLQPVSKPIVIWHGAMVGAVWAEGPHIERRPGGGWMLVAAEGGTARDHAVSVAYSDAITGPYTGDSGNPRLTHRDLGGRASIASVGHADLVDDQAGNTWATVLATRPVNGVDGLLGRQTYLVPVAWEEGRPVFSPGHGRVRLENEVPGVPDQQPITTSFDDDFDEAVLDAAWNGVGRHPSSFALLAERAGHVRLLPGADPGTLDPQSFLGRRLPAECTDVTAAVEVAPGEGALRGGLLLRTGERVFVEVSVDRHGVVRCESVARGVRSVIAECPGFSTRVEFSISVRDLSARVVADGTTIADVELAGLVPDPARGFVGVWVGPYAVGEGDGFVDVDWMHVTVRD